MATNQLPSSIATTDRTQKFINHLETQKTILTSCTNLFTSLTTHFSSLQHSLHQKSQFLDSKFQSLDSNSHFTLDSLSRRHVSLPDRESAESAAIAEKKERALLEFESSTKPENLGDSLRSFARRMDSAGLLRFMVLKRKESGQVRAEIPGAVNEAVDPARLVLDAVEEFLKDKTERVGVTDKRWACGMLVHALFPESGGNEGPRFARSVVDRVVGVLEKWKEEGEGGVVGPTEAVMFLQMVVGFGLRGRLEDEEGFLRKLVMEHAARKDVAKLAAMAGFGEKMGDIIDKLVTNGKEIEAVYLASESGLAERFPPVSLLKSFLKNSKILKNGKYNSAAMEESNTMELNSIRAIIKCVEDNKLESEFSLDFLRKRATQLEKAKADKKKTSAAATAKPQNKRSHGASGGRGSGPPTFRAAKAAKFSNPYPSFGRRNPAPPPQHSPSARYSGSYNYPVQGVYEGPTAIPHVSTYVVSHAAAIPQQHYSLPVETVGATGIRSSGSHGSQANYVAYDYGSGAPPAYQPPS